MAEVKCPKILLLLLLVWVSYTTFSQHVRQTVLFNDNWKFYKGDIAGADKESFDDNNWRQLDLPHDWSIEGPFDEKWASATGYLPAGIGWYRKTFEIGPGMRSKHIYLYFDGVYRNSEVWINGHYLGKRPNGFIPFQYELTKYLHAAGKNIVAVKADHTQFADSRWYTGSGIYRNVYMIATNAVSIDQWGIAFSTPQISELKAVAKVAVSLTNQSSVQNNIEVRSILFDEKGKQVAQSKEILKAAPGVSVTANINLPVPKPSLWSTEHPQLYKLEVSLYVNGKITDDVEQKVGFRFIKFDKDKGFFLNGKNLKLKGVCIHDDAGALGVAVPEEVWERRFKILKAAGCNSLRLSHNPHADYIYDLADKLGLLVMDEAFDEWELGKNKWIKGWNVGTPGQDGPHEYFKEWADRDLTDMVLRNRNHASIILWSIGNEIDYPNDPYTHEVLNTGNNPQIYGKGFTAGHPPASELTRIAKHLVEVVKRYDTTRPVTAALAGVVMSNEVGFPEVLDVVGYNYQEFRYPDDHKKYPNRIIYGSENGMALNAWDAVANNDYISAQYLWTGIDYLGEARQWPARSSEAGLIDLAGFTKANYYLRQSLWTDKPMIYIGSTLINKEINNGRPGRNITSAWNYKDGDSVRITCFTNCDEAELFYNETSLGKKVLSQLKERPLFWAMKYQPGPLTVKGYKNGKEVAKYILHGSTDGYAIDAVTDINSFDVGKKQTANIEITIVDQNANVAYDADNEITVSVEGPAKLLGLESGSSISHEAYQSNKRKAFHGRLLGYLQSTGGQGTVKIKISSPGLKQWMMEIK